MALLIDFLSKGGINPVELSAMLVSYMDATKVDIDPYDDPEAYVLYLTKRDIISDFKKLLDDGE